MDTDIIELIELSKDGKKTDGVVNIALGSVLYLARIPRSRNQRPGSAQLPDGGPEAASAHTDIDKVIVDKAASTVYLADPI